MDHRSLLDRQLAAADAGDFAQVAALDRTPEPKVGRTATAAARPVSLHYTGAYASSSINKAAWYWPLMRKNRSSRPTVRKPSFSYT